MSLYFYTTLVNFISSHIVLHSPSLSILSIKPNLFNYLPKISIDFFARTILIAELDISIIQIRFNNAITFCCLLVYSFVYKWFNWFSSVVDTSCFNLLSSIVFYWIKLYRLLEIVLTDITRVLNLQVDLVLSFFENMYPIIFR